VSPSTPPGAGPLAPRGTGSSNLEFDRVVVDDVSRHFGRRRAVSRVSFIAQRGAIVGLLGPNGAGKSTVLAMLATILRPSTGSIRYGTLDGVSGAALRARIGVLGHDLFLYPELTAHENLAFFASLYGLANADTAARSALNRAGLADRGGDLVTSFSRGMRQRVALERALIHEPRLVLLDEPFTGLDDASAAALVDRLRGLRNAGAIVILATHDLDLAESLLDEAVFLREGRMVQAVSRPEGLRSAYRRVMESRETGQGTR
jgi:ABC-type multidrug transport system ATPase subunit